MTPSRKTAALRFTGSLASIALLAAGLTGCGSTEPRNHTELTVGLSTAPVSLDPAKGANTPDGIFYSDLAYTPLITLNGDGSLSPGLASHGSTPIGR